jgi:hypothetical protein
MKLSFVGRSQDLDQPSNPIPFAWQVPTMSLGFSVVSFLASFCSVVRSPLAPKLEWDDEGKVGTLSDGISRNECFSDCGIVC